MPISQGTGVFEFHLPDIVEAKVVELVQDKTARNIFRVPAGVFKALGPVIAGVLGVDVARRDSEDLILEMTIEIASCHFQEFVEGFILHFDSIILIMIMFAKIAAAKPAGKAEGSLALSSSPGRNSFCIACFELGVDFPSLFSGTPAAGGSWGLCF
ncbi:hypothetical protein GE09DRAFT_1228631 [Coniochaeta sp. 2T2.1]|nr:hypothetical protein GE09DRAFT_1228631 [Coniochaeta sp. 2T2.1]